MRNILITGSNGQIGTNLAYMLAEQYPGVKILKTDLHPTENADFITETLDVLDVEKFRILVQEYKINEIYHLAAILSAAGEYRPEMAWQVNFQGLMNVLDIGKEFNCKIFWPSSIAVFGPTTPKHLVPQNTTCEPTTVYGISKYTGELWAQYYNKRYGVDIRSIRFPGLISWKGKPGGGTTDYAVEIFHEAVRTGRYDCFLEKDTYLPMLYMDDALEGILRLMETPKQKIKMRTSYNISGMSFSPDELATAIVKEYPEFKITYSPDERQAIANSWPASLDDAAARKDWNWNPRFDLPKMVKDMFYHLNGKAQVV